MSASTQLPLTARTVLLPAGFAMICSDILKVKIPVFQVCHLSAWDILQSIGGCRKRLSFPRWDPTLDWWNWEDTLEHNKRESCSKYSESLSLCCFFFLCLLQAVTYTCEIGLSPSCLSKWNSPTFKSFLLTSTNPFVSSETTTLSNFLHFWNMLCKVLEEWSSSVGSCLIF